MSSPVGGRRRSRDTLQMDAAEARPATFDWRVYDDDDVDAERRARLIRADLISSLESDRNRSRKRARVAASGDAVLGLQEARLGDAGVRMPAECAVCLQDFVAEDSLRAMPCSHTFHQDCILRWLRVNHVCPLCRHALPTQLVDDEDQDEGYEQGNSELDEILNEYHRQFYDELSYYEGYYNFLASMAVEPEQERA